MGGVESIPQIDSLTGGDETVPQIVRNNAIGLAEKANSATSHPGKGSGNLRKYKIAIEPSGMPLLTDMCKMTGQEHICTKT